MSATLSPLPSFLDLSKAFSAPTCLRGEATVPICVHGDVGDSFSSPFQGFLRAAVSPW